MSGSKQLNTPNCLEYYGQRKKPVPLPHFEYTILGSSVLTNATQVSKWIDTNLRGRYYLGRFYERHGDDFIEKTRVGFEIPRELTYFLISCPYLTN